MNQLSKRIQSYIPTGDSLNPPLIIAEAGVNHEGSMELAKRLIAEAKNGGADAIKFQSYKAQSLASKNSPAYWDTKKEATTNQFDLFKKYDRFWKSEFEALKIHCDRVGIEFLSTPFDLESADFLDDLMEVYKISSSDITNSPFIRHICEKGKPILLSTGASNLEEIEDAVQLIESFNLPLCLMHCILNYPTPDTHANLGMICDLSKKFDHHITGYSDHTLPGEMDVLIYAHLLGAEIIEKHFTHDKTLPGNDHYHAMDIVDLEKFKIEMARLYQLLGSKKKFPLESEKISRENARRSVVAEIDIKKGKIIQHSDLTWKRPGTGISPADISTVIGKRARKFIRADEIIKKDMIE